VSNESSNGLHLFREKKNDSLMPYLCAYLAVKQYSDLFANSMEGDKRRERYMAVELKYCTKYVYKVKNRRE
jgi:hypothetical protein